MKIGTTFFGHTIDPPTVKQIQGCGYARKCGLPRRAIIGATLAFAMGLLITVVYYCATPSVYEATSELLCHQAFEERLGSDISGIYEDVFNTRLADWRSEKVIGRVIRRYRVGNPTATIRDSELVATLDRDTAFDKILHSQRFVIHVQSTSAILAASLANAYAEVIEVITDEENRLRCDKAVAVIHEEVQKQRRYDGKLAQQLTEKKETGAISDEALKQLEKEKQISSMVLKELVQKENEARIAAEQNCEIVRVVRTATTPSEPHWPRPSVVCLWGTMLSFCVALLVALLSLVMNRTGVKKSPGLGVVKRDESQPSA